MPAFIPAYPGRTWLRRFRTAKQVAPQSNAAFILTNSFEGGVSGSSITTGGSGGISGNAFDTVSIGSGAIANWTNQAVANGNLAGAFSNPSPSVNSALVGWTSASIKTPQNYIFGRFYLNVTKFAGGSGTAIVYMLNNAGTPITRIQPSATGGLQVADFNNTVVLTTPGPIPVGQWVRVEWFATFPLTSTATFELRVYFNENRSGLPDYDVFASGINFNSNQCQQVKFGWTGAAANLPVINMDDVAITNINWLGPSQPLVTTGYSQLISPGRTWLRRFSPRAQQIVPSQAIPPPAAPTSAGSIYPSPAFPGRTWSNRFKPRAQQNFPLQPNPTLPFIIGSGTGAVSQIIIPVLRATSPGDTILVGLTSGGGATVSSVVDSQNNNYRQVASATNASNNSSFQWITTNPKPRALGRTDTITVTYSSVQSGQYGFALDCMNYNLVDQIAANTAASGSPSVTSAPVLAPELAVGMSASGSAGGSPIWATNWVQSGTLQSPAAAYGSVAWSSINTSAAVTASSTITSANWAITLVTLRIGQPSNLGPLQPGRTWSRRFNLPEHITLPSQQFISPPPPPTAIGSLIPAPINPGLTWKRRFSPRVQQPVNFQVTPATVSGQVASITVAASFGNMIIAPSAAVAGVSVSAFIQDTPVTVIGSSSIISVSAFAQDTPVNVSGQVGNIIIQGAGFPVIVVGPVSSITVSAPAGTISSSIPGPTTSFSIIGDIFAGTRISTSAPVSGITIVAPPGSAAPFLSAFANVTISASGGTVTNIPGIVSSISASASAGSIIESVSASTPFIIVQSEPGTITFPDVNIHGPTATATVVSSGFTVISSSANTAGITISGSGSVTLSTTSNAGISVAAPAGLAGGSIINGTLDDIPHWEGQFGQETGGKLISTGWSGSVNQ